MARAQPAKWVEEHIVLPLVATELGLHVTDAREPLRQALQDGDVTARYYPTKRDGSTSKLSVVPDNPDFWGTLSGRLGRDEIARIEYDRPSVVTWLSGWQQKGRRPGRETTTDWDGMWIEIIARANTPDGLDPEVSRTELIATARTWFESRGGAAPDDSTIGKKMTRLLERLRPK